MSVTLWELCQVWLNFVNIFSDVEKTVFHSLLLLYYPFVREIANR